MVISKLIIPFGYCELVAVENIWLLHIPNHSSLAATNSGVLCLSYTKFWDAISPLMMAAEHIHHSKTKLPQYVCVCVCHLIINQYFFCVCIKVPSRSMFCTNLS